MGSSNAQPITLKTDAGHPFQGYQAGEAESEQALLILHEWWGLKPHNISLAEQFADEGFLTLVIDLYDGATTDDPEQAGTWMRELDQEAADRKLNAALDYLSESGRTIAVYGCSMGGKQAMRATLMRPESVNATVLAYCRMETDVEQLKLLKGPVLAIYAEQERNWPEKQEGFEQAMEQADGVTESLSYDAGHGFTDPDSPRYDEQASRDHFGKAVEFLKRVM